MTVYVICWIFAGLFLKHFICDFPLQGPYQYLNKDNYGHIGGILHAGIQGLGTVIVLTLFGLWIEIALINIILIGIIETVIHYHVDWVKMNLNKKLNLKPDNSEQFWWLLGLDQLVHYLTYIGIILCLI